MTTEGRYGQALESTPPVAQEREVVSGAQDVNPSFAPSMKTLNNNVSEDHDGNVKETAGQGYADDMVVIENSPDTSPDSEILDEGDLVQSTSISNTYCGEWEKLFKRPNYLQSLRSFAQQGKLRSSRFRSVSWKLFLGVLREDQSQWIEKTREWRDKYSILKAKLVVNPHKSPEKRDLDVNNPLSQATESPWNQFFLDNELRVTIKQDVIRTFPEIQFYQDCDIRELMTNVLFCYAKSNSNLSYKQGMHELLAPLIFVLHCDHQAFLHACEIESVGEIVKELLNPDYVEHDSFALFCLIMETVEPWYVSKEISPPVKIKDVFSAQPFAKIQDCNPSNVIVTKLTRIQDYLLKKFDPELQAHLEKMEIAPQIYGIRWVRLLFGREFPMQDLLMLWDAIFADSISFDLVDYIFVGMLLYIRDAMLTSDYPSCLHLLMKYPPVGDVHYFVDKAIYLREPNQHPRPPDYTWQKPPSFGINGYETNGQGYLSGYSTYSRQSSVSSTRGSGSVTSLMSGLSTLTKKINQSRPRSLTIHGSPQRMSKSTSEPMNLITDQSPVQSAPPDRVRKCSTASLSQIEDDFSSRASNLKPALSSQSLARLETSSVRSAPETSQIELMSPGGSDQPSPAHRYSTLPGRGHRGKAKERNKERALEHDYAVLLGRLHDLQSLCKRCSERMDQHVGKLQKEILRQHMENEDELLLALAGLKQVRDVMKGTLKPSSLYDDEEISIRDDHYSKPGTYSRQDSREDMLSSDTEPSPETGDTGNTTSKTSANGPVHSSHSRNMSESMASTDSMGALDGAAGGMLPEIDGLTGVERHLMKREIELHDIRMQEERERETMERKLADLVRQEREAVLQRMSSGEWSSPGSEGSPNGKMAIQRQASDQALARQQQPLLPQTSPAAGRNLMDDNQNATVKPASLPVNRNSRTPSNSGSRRSSRDSSPMEKISGLFRSIKF